MSGNVKPAQSPHNLAHLRHPRRQQTSRSAVDNCVHRAFTLVALVLSLCTLGGGPDQALHDLPLNRLQVIGSHNSYKQALDQGVLEVARGLGRDLSSLDYAHPPMIDQLRLGLRNLELDLYHDPEGGRYATPLALRLLPAAGFTPRPYDPDGEMKRPGLKVLHTHDIDFRSHYYTFASALQELARFSEIHSDHLPVVVLLNLKSARAGLPGEVEPLPFDDAALAEVEREILEHLGPTRLIRPDDLRGTSPDLRTAVTTRHWPAVKVLAGRYLFVLDEGDPVRSRYTALRPGLRGAVLFPTVGPEHPDAGVMVINDPVREEARIREMVRRGFLVRTRADAGTREMREGNFSRFEAAVRSGAQVISTDYYIADWRINPDFVIRFGPGVYARPNPVFEPAAGRSP